MAYHALVLGAPKMNVKAAQLPRWVTSSFADADTAPMDLVQLGSHYTTCNGGRSRWFALQCAGEAVHDFVAQRFVTTLCLAAAAIALITVFG